MLDSAGPTDIHYHTGALYLRFHDLNEDFSSARPVTFNEDDTLPGAKRQRTIFNRDRFTRAEHHRPEMRMRVTVYPVVQVPLPFRHQLVQKRYDIASQPSLVLVDDDARGRMRREYHAEAGLNAAAAHDPLHLTGDINQLGTSPRTQCYSLHCYSTDSETAT